MPASSPSLNHPPSRIPPSAKSPPPQNHSPNQPQLLFLKLLGLREAALGAAGMSSCSQFNPCSNFSLWQPLPAWQDTLTVKKDVGKRALFSFLQRQTSQAVPAAAPPAGSLL